MSYPLASSGAQCCILFLTPTGMISRGMLVSIPAKPVCLTIGHRQPTLQNLGLASLRGAAFG